MFLKEKIPSGVVVHVQEGWMNEGGMKICFNKVWSQRPGGLLKKKKKTSTALLVYNHFKAHVTRSAKEITADLKTQHAAIADGPTSQLQHLAVPVNKPINALVTKEWTSRMQSAGTDLTPTGQIKEAPNRSGLWLDPKITEQSRRKWLWNCFKMWHQQFYGWNWRQWNLLRWGKWLFRKYQ